MKPFNGPRRQGGWIGIAAAVVGGIASSYGQQSAANKQQKVKYTDQRDLSNLQFEQQNWLAQQQHAWNLEDYQRTQNYKEDAIRGFSQYAPDNAVDPNGAWQAPPARTDVSADTANLAQTDANGNPLIYDPRTGAPVFANAQVPQQPVAPAKNVPLGQFG